MAQIVDPTQVLKKIHRMVGLSPDEKDYLVDLVGNDIKCNGMKVGNDPIVRKAEANAMAEKMSEDRGRSITYKPKTKMLWGKASSRDSALSFLLGHMARKEETIVTRDRFEAEVGTRGFEDYRVALSLGVEWGRCEELPGGIRIKVIPSHLAVARKAQELESDDPALLALATGLTITSVLRALKIRNEASAE